MAAKKSLIRDSCGGAYITEPCIQETTLAGMKNCDPASPDMPIVNPVSLRFAPKAIFRHSLWVFESPFSAFQWWRFARYPYLEPSCIGPSRIPNGAGQAA